MIIRTGSDSFASKWQTATQPRCLRSSVAAVVSSLMFSFVPLAGHAAGLGNISVFSSLGQPLRAEIEVTATREELSGMNARLASPSAFKQANVEYVTVLRDIKFTIDKGTNGRPVIKVKSHTPINEPFVDMLLELDWPTGRVLREYTFLLDPPELAPRNMAPVAPAKVANQPPINSSPDVATRSTPAADDGSREAAGTSAQALNRSAPDQQTGERASREVARGDTLLKIASQNRPDSVSLEQMLVGLWQANPKAFDGGNMNRLKVGAVLSIPDKATLEATAPKEARKIILAQATEWNAYRQKLSAETARGAAKEDQGQRDNVGKITAQVDEITTPATEAKDQVKVARLETVGSDEKAKAKQAEQDLITRNKALQETNDRIVTLEKNIADMQKLIALKNQQLASLQKSTAADPAPAETPTKPEQPSGAAQAAPEPALSSADKLAEPPTQQQAPNPGASPEIKRPTPPEAVQEASLVDELLESPLLLAAVASLLLLTLFAGYLVNKRRAESQTE